MKKVKQLLNYAANHTNTIGTYRASDMVLVAHSNTSYLSKSNARIQVGRYFTMSNNNPNPLNNRATLTIAQIIKAVMSSATEAGI